MAKVTSKQLRELTTKANGISKGLPVGLHYDADRGHTLQIVNRQSGKIIAAFNDKSTGEVKAAVNSFIIMAALWQQERRENDETEVTY